MSIITNLGMIGIGMAFMILRRSVLGGAMAGTGGALTALDPYGVQDFSADVLNCLIPTLFSMF